MIKKFFGKSKESYISSVVILAMVFGFSAGIVGQIVADVYIDPWRDIYTTQDFYPSTNTAPNIPELRRVERFLGIEQDFEVSKSVAKVGPALVGIYQKKNSGSDALSQIYLPSDLIANGFVLTSDGWLVSHQQALKNFTDKEIVVSYDQNIFAVEQMIVDSVTGVVFLKIPANNLGIVILGDSEETTLGQLSLVLNDLGRVMVVNVIDSDYQDQLSTNDFIFTSESYNSSLLVSKGITDQYLGSPLVNLGGEVVGVIYEIKDNGEALAVPINQFKSIILDILRSNIIKRPFLGVTYIDLAKSVGLDDELTDNLNRGALVYKLPGRNTPAFDAGLKTGDIILSVDGQLVDAGSSLAELIQQYQVTDEVNLEFSRDGTVFNESVMLSIQPD